MNDLQMSPFNGSVIPLRPRTPVAEPHLDCPICKDEALPARVLALDTGANLATVKTGCGESEVVLDLLDGVSVGDYILVHLGMAIARLDPRDVTEDG